MQVEIMLRDISPYERQIEEQIRERAYWLEQFCPDIINCRVVVEAPHKHRRSGRHFNTKIELYLPHKNVIVAHEHPLDEKHEDIFVAIRHAFDAARRRLEDRARVERGAVKAHESAPMGRVSRLYPEEDYGFIETTDGREIYFHRNSVLEGFDKLRVGSEVGFAEEQGAKGPQASTVRLKTSRRKQGPEHKEAAPL